jgi:hypothetical protein
LLVPLARGKGLRRLDEAARPLGVFLDVHPLPHFLAQAGDPKRRRRVPAAPSHSAGNSLRALYGCDRFPRQ